MIARNSKRFAFGRNWRAFLNVLDEERIIQAEASLKNLPGRRTFRKKPEMETRPCAA